jgi:hypothetical protein
MINKMMNLLNGLSYDDLLMANVGRMAARTTEWSNNRVIREKNDLEVYDFYCVAIHHIDTSQFKCKHQLISDENKTTMNASALQNNKTFIFSLNCELWILSDFY